MQDPSIDTCLRHAVERSRARTLVRHPEHAGTWSVTLPGAAVLTLVLEADGERLRLWAALGRVSHEQARHPVHALLAHFAVPASRDFVRALNALAAGPTTIDIYDATKVDKL